MSFSIGDTVTCECPGSWVHGRAGIIEALDIVSPDEIAGHLLKIPGIGMTVVEPECLRKVDA